ncbi:unnamed protein product [Bursaphelenchus okinawaensis]|uniref:Katanin p60 ATPase-containing subunit A1 n=1 Tax=Bursaphelenchus okinawaensis TaxID=465554 RepID=A0A811JTY2_9BILA|nr:unnamed protein product [Bursaphelenchus okinawaensis]CAG9083320.1 unnamed protein product [Bursaphelenchus okinawaensis]
MQQLDLARKNVRIGRYQLALNAYKSSLITFKEDLKKEVDSAKTKQLIEVVRLVGKELESLQSLVAETKNITISPSTPETPSDPMVWAPPAKPAKTISKKPPVPKRTTGGSGPRKGFASSVSTPKTTNTTPKTTVIRRVTSQPKLDDVSYNNVMDKEEDNEEEKVFDSTMYDRELVWLVEKSVIQRNPSVKWNDISGLETTKKTLTEAALLPQLFPTYFKGIRRPWKGVCLFGPPGTGKTLLAKAVATECKSTFFSVSASTFASKWRGDGEKLVRLLFEMARFYAPSTVFIDELDTLCSTRSSENEHEASKRLKGELLVQIDGMNDETDRTVLLLAATNRPWDLDEAFRRRLEKRIYVGLPDTETRLDLLKNCLSSVKLGDDVNLNELAAKTQGYSGADVTNLCRDAALQPMRDCLDNLEDYKTAAEQLSASFLEEKPIKMCHFNSAMKRVNPSCSADTIRKYKEWEKQFGAI